MKSAVIVFPGTNREGDIFKALKRVNGPLPVLVWSGDYVLPTVDLIIIPGGFSYGDYLRVGAIAAHSPIMREVVDAANKGIPILGICNGFQILTEIGLLPGTLMRNADLLFVCREVYMRVENVQTLFTNGYKNRQGVIYPVAHQDGNYYADENTLNQLEDEDCIAFRYCASDDKLTQSYNPNGSARDIAGIFNKNKTILGLMPHPENAIEDGFGSTDGVTLFKGIAEALV